MRMPSFSVLCASLLWVYFAPASSAQPAAPDFSKDVRPLLSKYCFKCHGPDDATRKGRLRLDDRESATKPAKSGAIALVPGNPASSEFIKRIITQDPDELMPPPSTKQALTETEKQILTRWVANGATYKPHWAFVPPTPKPLPPVQRSSWPKNAIDTFVLARLEKEHLAPAPIADRYTLVRRVYLDLIGLPPTPDEADAFVRDSSPNAYEQLVDRLLASPRYGERWARRWMDLARYADTNGYEKDRHRSIWPWRDWLIRALNADLPFDQFTREQIAGDLLPHPTRDQLVATGFHRNTMLNEEGGIDPLEFRYHAMTDRVNTTGAAWLGLTLGCAQCHTHKYDPIPHREYYQFMAFLDNADELDLDLPNPEADTRHRKDLEKAARLLAELPTKLTNAPASLDARFVQWLQTERNRSVAWKSLRPNSASSNLPLLTVQPDDSVFASGDITKNDTYNLTFKNVPAGTTAVRLEVLPDDRLPRHGPGMTYYEGPKGDFFMGEFQLFADNQPVPIARASDSYAKNAFGSSASAALAIDGDPQTGWSTSGREGERHEAVFVLASPLPTNSELQIKMMFGRHYACSLGRFRISTVTGFTNAVALDRPELLTQLLSKPDASLSPDQRQTLREFFWLSLPEAAPTRKEIESLRKPPSHTTSLVLQERPPENPRPTFIRRRGEFLQPTEQVQPGVLSSILPFPSHLPHNRLGFANWLISTNNPLTARVTANRQWQAFFGRGLVRTTEDFGFQGEPPSHPELLDWLALELTRHNWSLKALHKVIVLSATYQQSSRPTSEGLARDAENRLLSRGPRGRLDAESIRDLALQASGLLSSKLGGPSVYPPQPAGVTEITFGSPAWPTSQGEDRHRRSVYTYMKRTAPFAMFNTFDAPTGESCVPRRDVSNTPLQALTLLNDVFFIEVSQFMGRSLALQDAPVQERIKDAFRKILTRPPNESELAQLTAFFNAQQQRFSNGGIDPKPLAGEGPGNPAHRAAWTSLARALLNLDETISRH